MGRYKYHRVKLKNGKTKDKHRLIMEAYLCRELGYNECVHHKDGNPKNNDISNLEVIRRDDHMKLHIKNGDIVSRSTEEGKRKLCERLSVITRDIAERIKHGDEKAKDLAKEFGISKYVVSRIRTGKSWQHI